MSDTSKSLGLYWLLFLVSLVVQIAMVMFVPEWSWLALPFLLTFFVQAMDWM